MGWEAGPGQWLWKAPMCRKSACRSQPWCFHGTPEKWKGPPQESINGWMDKPHGLSIQRRIIWPYQGGMYRHTRHHRKNLENVRLMEEASHRRPRSIWFHLYEMSRRGKSTEHRMQISDCWGLKDGMAWLLWGDKNILELGSGDGCTTLWTYSTRINCVLQNGENN